MKKRIEFTGPFSIKSGAALKKVTAFDRYDPKTKTTVHNHIEDGWKFSPDVDMRPCGFTLGFLDENNVFISNAEIIEQRYANNN